MKSEALQFLTLIGYLWLCVLDVSSDCSCKHVSTMKVIEEMLKLNEHMKTPSEWLQKKAVLAN